MTKEEGNKLIAEFMGDEYVAHSDSWIYENDFRSYRSWRTSELKYQNSWDWLMPAVFKLHDVISEHEQSFAGLSIFEIGIATPINEVFLYCVEAIQWYNSQIQHP